ncbi:MAG: permease [Candidatus Zixiibacteriota bacterium]
MSHLPANSQKLKVVRGISVAKPQSNFAARLIIYSSISILLIDFTYKFAAGISIQNRQDCVLNTTLPKWAFMLYENLIELFLVVIVGIFAAALIEKYFSKVRRLIPRNCITAFIYASVIPICSCSAIPFVKTLENKIPYRALITFIIAAPLLNPYIIIVSMTILGYKYAVLRIICSFILAISTGYVVGFFRDRGSFADSRHWAGCGGSSGCSQVKESVFSASMNIIKKIAPYILAAGFISFLFEMINPEGWLKSIELSNSIPGTMAAILIGIPIYFCNGADVLFLKPFVHHGAISAGTAMAFSLTSTSICLSSFVMLLRYIGKRNTIIILASIILTTLLMSIMIQMLPIDFFSDIRMGWI